MPSLFRRPFHRICNKTGVAPLTSYTKLWTFFSKKKKHKIFIDKYDRVPNSLCLSFSTENRIFSDFTKEYKEFFTLLMYMTTNLLIRPVSLRPVHNQTDTTSVNLLSHELPAPQNNEALLSSRPQRPLYDNILNLRLYKQQYVPPARFSQSLRQCVMFAG